MKTINLFFDHKITCAFCSIHAQQNRALGIITSTPDASAILDIRSNFNIAKIILL
ncbi:hypothetical protein SAMN05444360_10159 [Chryseobacterium carnipullorum]|nr:hypothetical protein SAMN05444360_10159 [Chryseobacterium carnipullorum]